MKILAFAATNSRHSFDRALIAHATARLRADIMPDAEIETLISMIYEMPIYSIDREKENGIPAPAQDFFSRIGAADAVLVSFAEHNGWVTAAWKNIFDLISRIERKVFQNKRMAIRPMPSRRSPMRSIRRCWPAPIMTRPAP